MTGSALRRSPRWRRRLVVGGVALGGAAMAASVAYACILRTGSLLVCSPPSRTYTTGTECSKAAGTGGQSGFARLSLSGSPISVKARHLGEKPYAVLFRAPGTSGGCTTHNETTAGRSLLGVDAEGKPNTVMGPRFYRGRLATPALTTQGRAQVCVIDQPERITSQTVNVAVI